VQLVFVSTRHDSHAEFTCRALEAGKHVWVEKPLALTLAELKDVAAALRKNPACRLVVGFNRPFSRSARWLSGKLGALSPPMMFYRVNAGQVPSDSWVHDPAVGGGRLLGEGCHFFDFLSYFAGTSAESVHTETPAHGRSDLQATGNFACTVRFQNASVGQLLYSAQGAPSMGKEYFECFTGQSCGSISDYRSAEFFHREEHDSCSPHRQDKGQASLLEAFIACLRQGGPPPMSPEQILESSILTLAAQHSLLTRTPVAVADFRKELA
jgi:predicted dehydrogenase